MKIKIKGGDGWELHYERTPISKDRLEMILTAVGMTVATVAIIAFPILLELIRRG